VSVEALPFFSPVVTALMRAVPTPKLLPEILAGLVASLPDDALEAFEQALHRMVNAIVRAETGAANDPS